LFAIVAVFAAGLMIGRTPEYLGKKIEGHEVKMTMLALLCVPAFILGMSGVGAVLPAGLAGLSNAGPHGFGEMLYAYTSGAATNGSAFAGLSANTPFYNLTLAAAMFAGRFIVIIPVLCIAAAWRPTDHTGLGRSAADTRHAVHRFAGWHGGDRRRTDLLPALALDRCGTLRHAGGLDLLIWRPAALSEQARPHPPGAVCRAVLINPRAVPWKVIVVSLLVVATTLEAEATPSCASGCITHAIGARIFCCFGLSCCFAMACPQRAPFDFGRLIGAYVATFFVVGQIINLVVFRAPQRPRHFGGLLILPVARSLHFGTLRASRTSFD
jgi:hypothetical protein